MEAMAHEMPLRLMLMVSDGSMTREMLDALLEMLNGRTMGGLISFVRALRRKDR